jgi:Flp pilus assembly protein TadG
MNRWEKGQSFVEMAFGSVVLILLIGGLIDLGRAFLILVAVENATGEGALYGATNPECLKTDYGPSFCRSQEDGASVNPVFDRVREEGKPIINLTSSNSTMEVLVDSDGEAGPLGSVPIASNPDIVKGANLTVKVQYRYSPVTPIGFMIWGSTAEVRATAHQEILSPPRKGYNY